MLAPYCNEVQAEDDALARRSRAQRSCGMGVDKQGVWGAAKEGETVPAHFHCPQRHYNNGSTRVVVDPTTPA